MSKTRKFDVQEEILMKIRSKMKGAGIAFVLLILLGMMAGNIKVVHAETYGDFEYTLMNEGTKVGIVAYDGRDAKLVIPDEIDGLPVTAILEYEDAGIFSGFSPTSVSIPASVTNIADCTFSDCRSLMEITVAEGNPNYKSIDGILYDKECKEIIMVPDKKTGAVKIAEGVTKIGDEAFRGCSSLTSVSIPTSVTRISEYDFDGCSELTEVTVAEGNLNYKSIDGILYDKACEELMLVPAGKTGTLKIPEGVRVVGDYAFRGCSSLTSVSIPTSVTRIYEDAFRGCSELTEIAVAEGNLNYQSIDGILYDKECKEIIMVPAKKAGTVKIAEGVTEIGYYAFDECSELTEITVAEGNPNYKSIDGILYDKECKEIIMVPNKKTGAVKIAEGVTEIGAHAFSGCSGLTSVSIAEGVTEIGYEAFRDCSSLTSVSIPTSVTRIYDDVFRGCSELTEIAVAEGNLNYQSIDGILYDKACEELMLVPAGKTGTLKIPEGVTEIGSDAFYGCSSLTSVSIPTSVTGIHDDFYGCSELTEIAVAEGNLNYQSIDGILYDKACEELMLVPAGETGTLKIPEGVTKIWYEAFRGCSGLTSVSIPASVTSIEDSAFEDCSSLTSVSIPEGVTSIGQATFSGCSGLTSVSIPEGVTSIGWRAFEDCSSLTSVSIPASVTSIEDSAFEDCSSLTSVSIPEGVTSIGRRAFRGCSGLTSISIPASVTRIDPGAFSGCSELTEVIVTPGSYAETYAKGNNIPYTYSGEKWTVTIKNSSGKVVKTLRADKGAVLPAPEPSEERSNETFLGFFNGDTKFDFSKPITDDITLTEKWEKKKDNPEALPQENGITLNTKTLSFDTIGTTKTLTATISSGTTDKTVTWTSFDTKVATVTDGVVTSVGNGTATITAKTADGKTASALVTVSQKTTKLSIQLNNQNVSGTLKAKVKKSYSFKAVVEPDNADTKNAKVTWTSSNKKIATVTDKGKVTIKKPGKVTITAKTADGREASVKLNASRKAVKVTKLKISGNKSMKVKAKQTLKITITPATADNRKVTWKSSNKKVATVNSKGVVTAKKKGKVTITATAKDGSRKKATIKITVKK